MPVGTVNNDPQRYPLASAPADPNIPGDEDGYIMARPLPYGMKLDRRDKALEMSMEQKVGQGRKSRRQNEEVQKIDLKTMNAWAMQHDMAYCITDHNITDVNGVKLDFANPMTMKILDPRIGAEIEEILSELNGDVDEDELENFTKLHTSPSPDEEKVSD